MKYLIIGNGAAGVAAAERIRKLDGSGEITILSAEQYAVYSKCLLPDFLSGQVTEDSMFIRDKDFYEKKNINIYYSHKVLDIDFRLKHVTTNNIDNFCENGSVFDYDKLLIASGSSQDLPPIAGLKETNVYFLRNLDDAKNIIKNLGNVKRIIIIGAGFVGLEMAFNLYKRGKEITVIEKAPRVLPGQLDEKASRIIQNSIEEEGIRLILNANIKEVAASLYSNMARLFTGNRANSVVLDDGRRFKTDMIIVASGSRPNLDFIKTPALKIRKGIIVDPDMQTSLEDVYAAGDVVESIDAVTGKSTLSPIWPNAVIQGEVAGSNMAGNKRELDNLINMQNASEFREIPMISMGMVTPDEPSYMEYSDYRPVDMVYRKVVIKDNTIVGMIFLGDIKNAGVIGSLMKQKINVEKIKKNILNPNFGFSEVSANTSLPAREKGVGKLHTIK